MLCRVRLHGPSGRPEKQRDKAGMSQRAGRLHHRYPWGADGTGVSRNSQNGKFYLRNVELLFYGHLVLKECFLAVEIEGNRRKKS